MVEDVRESEGEVDDHEDEAELQDREAPDRHLHRERGPSAFDDELAVVIVGYLKGGNMCGRVP